VNNAEIKSRYGSLAAVYDSSGIAQSFRTVRIHTEMPPKFAINAPYAEPEKATSALWNLLNHEWLSDVSKREQTLIVERPI
jgi:hypothetical protein